MAAMWPLHGVSTAVSIEVTVIRPSSTCFSLLAMENRHPYPARLFAPLPSSPLPVPAPGAFYAGEHAANRFPFSPHSYLNPFFLAQDLTTCLNFLSCSSQVPRCPLIPRPTQRWNQLIFLPIQSFHSILHLWFCLVQNRSTDALCLGMSSTTLLLVMMFQAPCGEWHCAT